MNTFSIYALTACFCIGLYIKRHFSYWKRLGIPQVTPVIPFGCMLPFIQRAKSAGKAIGDNYYKSDAPFVGIYVFHLPQLIIRDLELLRRIMITDFEYFRDRNVYINQSNDPLSVNVFAQKGQKWLQMRRKLSPMFSTGKLKCMFPIFVSEVEKLDKYLEASVAKNEVIDLRGTITNYTLNVIGSVFFGLEVDTLDDPQHIFKRMYEITSRPPNPMEVFRQSATFFFPQLIKLFNIYSVNKEIRDYFTELVKQTVKFRENNNFRRNDVLQLLIDMRNESEEEMSIEEVAGNAYIFFFAGAETSTSIGFYCLYELCRHPELWKKAQKEVDEVLEQHGNKFCYEAIKDIKYIDCCIKEARRIYTGFPCESRMVVKDYKIPGYDITLKKGTPILLPFGPIHVDPKYFPKPMEFIPERFEKESDLATPNAYFPAGAGPRHCIAFQMGWLLAKAVVVKMLSKYKLSIETKGNVNFDPDASTTLLREAIRVKIELR